VIFEVASGERSLRLEVSGGDGRYRVNVDGRDLECDARDVGHAFLSLLVQGRSHDVGLLGFGGRYTASLGGEQLQVELAEAARGAVAPRRGPAGPTGLLAPMPGRLVRILVAEGQEVRAGEGLVVMEAMKMENELRSPRAGRVRELHVRERQAVETGALLVTVE
jgi:acetyl/propionyl-CoA carboxylase alpha subunit